MNKNEAVLEFLRRFPDSPVVTSTGYISRIAQGESRSKFHFYMLGSMGLALPIAAGMSLRSGAMAVAIDGDGSALMGMNGMLLANELLDSVRVLHVVINDGIYDSTGGQQSPGSCRRLPDLALAAGYKYAVAIDTLVAIEQVLAGLASESVGFAMIDCRVGPAADVPPRVAEDPPVIFSRVRHALCPGSGQPATQLSVDDGPGSQVCS